MELEFYFHTSFRNHKTVLLKYFLNTNNKIVLWKLIYNLYEIFLSYVYIFIMNWALGQCNKKFLFCNKINIK